MNVFNEAFTIALTGILIYLQELVTLHVGWVSSNDCKSFTLLIFINHSDDGLDSTFLWWLFSIFLWEFNWNFFFLFSLWHLQVHHSFEIDVAFILNFFQYWLSTFFSSSFWNFIFIVFLDDTFWIWNKSNFVSNLLWFNWTIITWHSLSSNVNHNIEDKIHGLTTVFESFSFISNKKLLEFNELIIIKFWKIFFVDVTAFEVVENYWMEKDFNALILHFFNVFH